MKIVSTKMNRFFLLFFFLFFASGVGFPADPAAHQDHCCTVDAGYEPGTSAPEVWCATNEPPHLPKDLFTCNIMYGLYLGDTFTFRLILRMLYICTMGHIELR